MYHMIRGSACAIEMNVAAVKSEPQNCIQEVFVGGWYMYVPTHSDSF
jgi:hypothetical protein